MKKIYVLTGVIALLTTSCDNGGTIASDTSDSTALKTAVALPYTASYSSSFKMGNPAHSALILQGSWKDWETNNLDNMKSWVADTITAFHSNGVMIKGVDSMIAVWKRQRANYTSVIDTVQAVFPVRSTDRNEDWVLVWAQEIHTKADGAKDTVWLMETWRINKDGKADFLLQYERSKDKK